MTTDIEFSDRQAENAFISWFNELNQTNGTAKNGSPSKNQDQDDDDDEQQSTIRLFERSGGDFYHVYGSDAQKAASIVFKTTTVIKLVGGSLPSCALNKPNAILLIKKALFEMQSCVHIYTLEPRKSNSWILSKKASPGNLIQIEDLIFADDVIDSSPVAMALKVVTSNDQPTVGVAFCDASSEFKIKVAEFVDDHVFSNLESLVAQVSAKECLISEDLETMYVYAPILKKIATKMNMVLTKVKKSKFSGKDIEQDLGRLLNHEFQGTAESKFQLSLTCVSALISYLDLNADEANHGMFQLESHQLSSYMRLDVSAIQALNVFPGPNDNKQTSLFGLLNKCKTSQGTRLLIQWLKQPLMNIDGINVRLNIVESFINDTELREILLDKCLRLFPDLHRLAKKFQRGKAHLQDVVRIYQVLLTLPDVYKGLSDHEGEYKEVLNITYSRKLEEYQESLDKLKDMIEITIDLAAVDQHEYRIKADFDEQLQETKSAMDQLIQAIETEAEHVANDLNLELDKKLKFEKSPIYGYHLRLSRFDSSKIRNKSQFIELSTQKSGVLFTTSKMRKLSNEYNELKEAYDAQQQTLVKEIINVTATYFPVLEQLNQLIAHMDVLLSFAVTSIQAPSPYVRPIVLCKGKNLSLTRSRHPCLELQDDVSFIPNDVQMDREHNAFHIITGPNMGGKSTYIRQVGLIALMTQIGCFVPCDSAEICIFDAILARVGAGDCQLKGISTFMYEMLETSTIIKCATKDSLIIIDELGRGTSTYDGFGLAWAIAEHIAKNINCFTFFATHFHELVAMDQQIPYVTNKQVLVQCTDNEMILLYKVVDGACDESFGIHVAELANFPNEVVQLAKRKVNELESVEENQGSKSKKPLWNASEEKQMEGMKIIHQFMSEFKNMNECPKEDEVYELKQIYKNVFGSNDFIQEILN